MPFSSKKDILPELEHVLAEVEGIESQVSAESCEYESVSTVSHGTPLLLAVQRRDIALAHKVGAWNERGLI